MVISSTKVEKPDIFPIQTRTPHNTQSITVISGSEDLHSLPKCDPAWLSGTAAILSAVAWPLVVAILAFVFRKAIANFFSLFPKLIRKVKGGGVEIELNREAATEIRTYFKGAFDELIKKAHEEFDHEIKVERLGDLLQRILTETLSQIVGADALTKADSRATIYVPDIIFEDF